jgi:hypothetical protein
MQTQHIRVRPIFFPASTEELNFEEIFAIEDLAVAKQAFKLAQFFQGAVVNQGDDQIVFDIQKAKALVDENKELALVQTVDQTLVQTHDSVEAMVEQVLGLLNAVLDLALGLKQQDQLRASITNAFTNLAPQEGDAWIFWSKTEAEKTVYQYNIMFAVQNAETGHFLYGLPMGMTINVDIKKEQVLFIKLSDKASYSVRVQSMKVVSFLETEIERRALALLRN